MKPSLSLIDKLVINTDQALKTLTSRPGEPRRPSPGAEFSETNLNEAQQAHIAGLMRINHSGEVCAQALYQGQALTAKQDHVRTAMACAAREEEDHLAWCEQRIHDMGSHTSFFNPLWYAMSFTLGATAGAIGDKISLGFVAATEDQVCEHLDSHLQQLPDDDVKTRAILVQMREDEARHASKAIAEGGSRFPSPVKKLMSLIAKVMTTASYKI